MATSRYRKAAPRRPYRRRQPSLWNTLMFRLSLLPPFNPLSEFPMSTRRNVMIRSVAVVCGDVAAAVALASACAWLIEAASLGLFLGFLVWLLGALMALALSQYLVHPAVNALLCDRKLDRGIEALSALAQVGTRAGRQLWSRFRPAA